MKLKYEIVSLDYINNVMLIKYIDEDKTEMLVGAKIPYEDEDLEETLQNYAPKSDLKKKSETRKLKSIKSGLKGSIDINLEDRLTVNTEDLEKLQMEQIKSIVKEILNEYKLI